MDEPVRITAICGSLSPAGATSKALTIALKGAAEYDAETSLVQLREFDLVLYGSAPIDEYPSDVSRLRQVIKESQGIILGSPEYHGSLSGALKNMLDLMTTEEFETKIVGLVGVAGGSIGAIKTLDTLKTICQSLHCWVLPQEVSIASSGQAFADDETLKDPQVEERLLNIGRQLMKFASLQRKAREGDFMQSWKSLPTW